jgi:hypothetical protein
VFPADELTGSEETKMSKTKTGEWSLQEMAQDVRGAVAEVTGVLAGAGFLPELGVTVSEVVPSERRLDVRIHLYRSYQEAGWDTDTRGDQGQAREVLRSLGVPDEQIQVTVSPARTDCRPSLVWEGTDPRTGRRFTVWSRADVSAPPAEDRTGPGERVSCDR